MPLVKKVSALFVFCCENRNVTREPVSAVVGVGFTPKLFRPTQRPRLLIGRRHDVTDVRKTITVRQIHSYLACAGLAFKINTLIYLDVHSCNK